MNDFVGHPTAGLRSSWQETGESGQDAFKTESETARGQVRLVPDGCKQPRRALTNDIRFIGREARSVKHGGLNLLVKKDEANHITLHEALPAEAWCESTMSEGRR